jgi:hypothetical protein
VKGELGSGKRIAVAAVVAKGGGGGGGEGRRRRRRRRRRRLGFYKNAIDRQVAGQVILMKSDT